MDSSEYLYFVTASRSSTCIVRVSKIWIGVKRNIEHRILCPKNVLSPVPVMIVKIELQPYLCCIGNLLQPLRCLGSSTRHSSRSPRGVLAVGKEHMQQLPQQEFGQRPSTLHRQMRVPLSTSPSLRASQCQSNKHQVRQGLYSRQGVARQFISCKVSGITCWPPPAFPHSS